MDVIVPSCCCGPWCRRPGFIKHRCYIMSSNLDPSALPQYFSTSAGQVCIVFFLPKMHNSGHHFLSLDRPFAFSHRQTTPGFTWKQTMACVFRQTRVQLTFHTWKNAPTIRGNTVVCSNRNKKKVYTQLKQFVFTHYFTIYIIVFKLFESIEDVSLGILCPRKWSRLAF